ncbi:hypothetical protein DFP72DRAFT_860895 [Ephemerocybe angulata]|uniref:Uncharacterized protein n=1 Tax=Ephemerocybe angulata TaxID=980116 RepID=A0A8H6H847_9AGAR|nr:hypothetical protein DFP72DRAFT_860895 [Tulosesus angulatus]
MAPRRKGKNESGKYSDRPTQVSNITTKEKAHLDNTRPRSFYKLRDMLDLHDRVRLDDAEDVLLEEVIPIAPRGKSEAIFKFMIIENRTDVGKSSIFKELRRLSEGLVWGHCSNVAGEGYRIQGGERERVHAAQSRAAHDSVVTTVARNREAEDSIRSHSLAVQSSTTAPHLRKKRFAQGVHSEVASPRGLCEGDAKGAPEMSSTVFTLHDQGVHSTHREGQMFMFNTAAVHKCTQRARKIPGTENTRAVVIRRRLSRTGQNNCREDSWLTVIKAAADGEDVEEK